MNIVRIRLVTCIIFICISSISQLYAQVEGIASGNIYSSHFTIDDKGRDISYYIPANYAERESHSLILVLSADNEPLQTVLKNYADVLHAKADSTSTIIMYPQSFSGLWHWADSNYAVPVNDVGFINIMVDYFIQQHRCDPKKIYVIGFGNGGKMGCRLSCELRTGIAAAASISVASDIACNCKNAVNTFYADVKNIKRLPGKKIISDAEMSSLINELIKHTLP